MTTITTYTPARAKRLILDGKAKEPMLVTGSLDLRDTQITALPDNLTVSSSLYLSGTQITALPDNLTVGSSLYLSGTQITALPDNLTVGGWIDLRGTQITALPDNLTVGGWIDLRGTQITALPDNLTVGGSLYLSGTQITALPTPWWTGRGEATRRRCLAVCQAEGYALVQSDTDRFSAGCRNNLTRAQALAHWNRSDARAKLFTAAIEGAVL